MHLKSDDIEVMAYDKSDEVIEELFESLFCRYQSELETLMKVSNFIFDSVYLLHYICHKINLKRGGSDIDSPDWIKNMKATINPINDADKFFQ